MKNNEIKTKNFLVRVAQLLFALLIILIFYPYGYKILNDSYNFSSDINNHLNNHENISQKSIKTYLVNLDRSIERLKYVKPKIEKLDLEFTRFSAIEGNKLSEDEKEKLVNFSLYKKYMGDYPKNGTIGCSLSHFHIWEDFLKSDYEYALIFEDDVEFDHEKLKKAIAYLTNHPNLWDITSFEILHRGAPLTIKKFEDDIRLVVYLFEVTHTGSYIINRKAAKALLSKALPIKIPVDHYFTRGWELDLKFTGIEPRIVHQRFGDSEIENSFSKKIDNLTLLQKVKRSIYKVQTAIIRFYYNIKIYLKYTSV